MLKKTMKMRFQLVILGIVILIAAGVYFQLYVLQHREIIKPPPAILNIGGKEQTSGIGSYCWNGELSSNGVFSSVCADYAGIPTIGEPLSANSTFIGHLSLPLKEPPQELHLMVVQVTNKDVIETGSGDLRFWNPVNGKYSTLPLKNEQDVNLSLKQGLYVLEVFPEWKEHGSASYGFLLEVK